jgi:hypothetical protein
MRGSSYEIAGWDSGWSKWQGNPQPRAFGNNNRELLWRRIIHMGKFMQVDIRVIPIYEKSLAEQFPRITDLLKQMYYTEPVEKEVSLYALVDYMVSVGNNPETPDDIKRKIKPYVQKMLSSKRIAREQLLSKKLNELDKTLYLIEDQFEDLEGSL